MNYILLVLSTTHQSPKAVELALDLAKEANDMLVVLFVLDSRVPDHVFGKLSDIGFVGEKPSNQLIASIMREYRQQGYARLEEIKKIAEEKGIQYKMLIEKGNIIEQCIKVAKEYKVTKLIIPRRKQSALYTLFFGSPINELKKILDCDINIVDEE